MQTELLTQYTNEEWLRLKEPYDYSCIKSMPTSYSPVSLVFRSNLIPYWYRFYEKFLNWVQPYHESGRLDHKADGASLFRWQTGDGGT